MLNYKVNLPGFGVCVLTETSPPATNIKNVTIFIWQWQIKGVEANWEMSKFCSRLKIFTFTVDVKSKRTNVYNVNDLRELF